MPQLWIMKATSMQDIEDVQFETNVTTTCTDVIINVSTVRQMSASYQPVWFKGLISETIPDNKRRS
jgi:hypothetical protein